LAASNESVELDVPCTLELAAGQFIGLAPLRYRVFADAETAAEETRPP
jgi:hypothetical protein